MTAKRRIDTHSLVTKRTINTTNRYQWSVATVQVLVIAILTKVCRRADWTCGLVTAAGGH